MNTAVSTSRADLNALLGVHHLEPPFLINEFYDEVFQWIHLHVGARPWPLACYRNQVERGDYERMQPVYLTVGASLH